MIYLDIFDILLRCFKDAYLYIFSRRPMESRYKDMTDSYKAPKNVARLQTPKTNADIWELLNRGVQIVDSTTQRVQNLQVSSLAVLVRIVDQIGGDEAGACADHVTELSDAVTMMVMGFSYLSQVRKELIRNALGYPLAKFCTWDTPVGVEDLFPDLSKKLKEREESQLKLRRRNRYGSGGYG